MTDAAYGWTEADGAELDVLMFELVRSYWDHKERGCEACNPEPCPILVSYREHKAGCWSCDNSIRFETAYYKPCPRYLHFIAHGTCKRCNPCPHLKAAIAVVVDWREGRSLRSRAEALRLEVSNALETSERAT